MLLLIGSGFFGRFFCYLKNHSCLAKPHAEPRLGERHQGGQGVESTTHMAYIRQQFFNHKNLFAAGFLRGLHL